MDSVFFIKLVISFFISGLWIVLASILADKFGSKIGGLISGLPTTIAFALFFIAWTQTSKQAVEATTIVPIVEGIDCLFIAVYCYFARKNIWISLLISYLVWFILSFWLAINKFNSSSLSILGYIALLILSFIFIEKFIKVKSLPEKKIKYTPTIILLRGILSGSIITFAVFMGKAGGPIWGGVFSAFPAMMTSTILISYFSQGAQFSIATMKSMMISVGSVVFYAVCVKYLYPPMGVAAGTVISLILSYLSGIFIYKYFIKRIS